jgi:hypothetical protein
VKTAPALGEDDFPTFDGHLGNPDSDWLPQGEDRGEDKSVIFPLRELKTVDVPFGRYKGKPIEQMLTDKAYALKQLQSEAVCLLYPEFVAVLQSRLSGSLDVDGLPPDVDGLPPDGVEVSASEPPSPAPVCVGRTGRLKRSVPQSLPSPYQMGAVYRWLIRFNTDDRKRGRIQLPQRFRFLSDWIADTETRAEFEREGGLSWRDWNLCYIRIENAAELMAFEDAESE